MKNIKAIEYTDQRRKAILHIDLTKGDKVLMLDNHKLRRLGSKY